MSRISKNRETIANVSGIVMIISLLCFIIAIIVVITSLASQGSFCKNFNTKCGVHLKLAAEATDIAEAQGHARDAMVYVMSNDLQLKNEQTADWLRELEQVTNNIEADSECDRGTFDDFRSFVSAAPPDCLASKASLLEDIKAYCFMICAFSFVIGAVAYLVCDWCCTFPY